MTGGCVVVVVTRIYPDLPAYSTTLFTTVFRPSQGGTGCGSAHKPSFRLWAIPTYEIGGIAQGPLMSGQL